MVTRRRVIAVIVCCCGATAVGLSAKLGTSWVATLCFAMVWAGAAAELAFEAGYDLGRR